jgi:hypothetical protein
MCTSFSTKITWCGRYGQPTTTRTRRALVGKLWAHNFVKRQPQLRTRFSRRYDYHRAKCEDPKVIAEWFALVRNTKAKYGIVDDDVYNFDETGFMMGIIFAGMVATTSDGRGKAKLAQPGNREWATVIQGVNALGWAIPPFIILAAQYHLANWYTECDLPANWRIATTDNGWTTNVVGLDWIKHFDFHTAPQTKGKYRLSVANNMTIKQYTAIHTIQYAFSDIVPIQYAGCDIVTIQYKAIHIGNILSVLAAGSLAKNALVC